jgi:hypothetical protein
MITCVCYKYTYAKHKMTFTANHINAHDVMASVLASSVIYRGLQTKAIRLAFDASPLAHIIK